MDEYDLLVVGAGSGLDVANTAANAGLSVAIVEKGPLGGTCLNRGCIPSKMLLYHAHVMETVQRASAFGIDAEVTDVDFSGFVSEVAETVAGNAAAMREDVESDAARTLYDGEARFVGDRTVELADGPDEGARVRGENVLVATGARPLVPPIDGLADVEYLTSTEALTVTDPPDHLVVIGGGYIGAELGHFFETFGSDVSVLDLEPHMIPIVDDEVAHAFTESVADRFDLYVGYQVSGVSGSGDSYTVEARPAGDDAADDEPVAVTGDELLLAVGRVPNTDRLDLEAAGVETDDRGFVETDEYLQTSAEGVWAIGDVIGEPMLKHVANHEAQTAMVNILTDSQQAIDYDVVPFAVFSSPEVAGVGATEAEVSAEGREYETTRFAYDGAARGKAMQAEGFLKLITAPDGEILGCHIVGPEASVLIQEVVVAMQAGTGTKRDITQSIHIHPALTEVVSRGFAGKAVPGPEAGHEAHGARDLAIEDASDD